VAVDLEPVEERRGEGGDFEARLAAHRGIVLRIASAWCPAGEERADLVQEIHLQLWRAWPRFDPARRFSTWMYRVALNTAISYSRSGAWRRRAQVSLDDAPAATAVAAPPPSDLDERLDRLERALRALGELDRALVVLHLEERSHREIGEILGLKESNVGTRLARLKQRLRRTMLSATEEDA
jgi:RNA polymerase sigma-70 factor (ECF subfamily)